MQEESRAQSPRLRPGVFLFSANTLHISMFYASPSCFPGISAKTRLSTTRNFPLNAQNSGGERFACSNHQRFFLSLAHDDTDTRTLDMRENARKAGLKHIRSPLFLVGTT